MSNYKASFTVSGVEFSDQTKYYRLAEPVQSYYILIGEGGKGRIDTAGNNTYYLYITLTIF